MPPNEHDDEEFRGTAVQTIKDRLEFPDKIAVKLEMLFEINADELVNLTSEIDLLEYIATQRNVSITIHTVEPV